MSDRTNHRRVLHFAVTGVLLGSTVGCTSNEPAKSDAKADAKGDVKGDAKKVEPPKDVVEFAPNPGPNDRNPLPPDVAPTTAVAPEPVDGSPANEGAGGINPGPTPDAKPEPTKRVNTGPVEQPEPKPPIVINPGPIGPAQPPPAGR